MNSPYPSSLLENAVSEFARLPGIGRKSALRLVLHLLRQDKEKVSRFVESILKLTAEVKYCSCCHNISDSEICNICADKTRDSTVICVVENIKEVMAIEKTVQFGGLYHVLGGIISPIDGIGPSDLEIASLEERVKSRWYPGGHSSTKCHHGRRHHQFLYLSQAATLWCQNKHYCPGSFYWR